MLLVLPVALGVLALWPYHEILTWLPWGADATKWVFRGASDGPWWTWALSSKHFVGYRPVAALSYTLNHATTGYAAAGYRATDLALHVASGAAMFSVYRSLTRDRGWLGFVPVVVLLLHPATEEIVPHVARRSYLLAATFGLAAISAWCRALATPRPSAPWAVGSAALVGLAVLSNELAYVVPPVLLLLALGAGHRPRDVGVALLPIVLVVGAAVAARYQVLGTFGGYAKRYFAFVEDGHPRWRELSSWQPGRIADAAWRYVLVPNGVTGGAPALPGPAGIVGAAAFSVWLGWVGLVTPARRPEAPARLVRPVLVAWILGGLAIIVGSQTWFWRQAYGLLPPLGLLVAIGLADGGRAVRAGATARGGVSLGAGAALLLCLLWNAPLPRMHLGEHAATRAGSPLVRTAVRFARQTRGQATIYLVVPLRAPAAHMVRLWTAQLAGGRGREVVLLGHLTGAGRQGRARLSFDREAQRLKLDRDLQFADGAARGAARSRDGALELARLGDRVRGRPSYVVAMDADDAWMVRVKAGAAAAPAPTPPDQSE